MTVTAVDHVEFYVGDGPRLVRFLCGVFGFRCHGRGGPETGLVGRRSWLLGAGGAWLVVTSPVGSGPVGSFVEVHGDGVACVGLRCGDVRGAAAAAVAGGAAVVAEPSMWGWGDAVGVSAVVSGPGGVVHRMVQRAGVGGQFLAGLVPVLPEPEGEGEGLLHGVDHVAWCVPGDELGSVTDFYRRVFGLVEVFRERIEVGEQVMDSRVVQSGSRQVTFTIVCPDGGTRSGQLVDFLAGNAGAGVQHLALGTRDIAAAVDRFQGRGLRFLAAPDSYYDAVAGRLGRVSLPVDDLRARSILVDRDHHGEMFQIFSESPFARETFFFELIERHGALTFGSNNVRALYEAKERARAGGGGDRVVAGVGGEVDA